MSKRENKKILQQQTIDNSFIVAQLGFEILPSCLPIEEAN